MGRLENAGLSSPWCAGRANCFDYPASDGKADLARSDTRPGKAVKLPPPRIHGSCLITYTGKDTFSLPARHQRYPPRQVTPIADMRRFTTIRETRWTGAPPEDRHHEASPQGLHQGAYLEHRPTFCCPGRRLALRSRQLFGLPRSLWRSMHIQPGLHDFSPTLSDGVGYGGGKTLAYLLSDCHRNGSERCATHLLPNRGTRLHASPYPGGVPHRGRHNPASRTNHLHQGMRVHHHPACLPNC